MYRMHQKAFRSMEIFKYHFQTNALELTASRFLRHILSEKVVGLCSCSEFQIITCTRHHILISKHALKTLL